MITSRNPSAPVNFWRASGVSCKKTPRRRTVPEIFQTGNLTVDTTVRVVRINGEPVRLSATEIRAVARIVFATRERFLRMAIYCEQSGWGIDDPEKISLLRVYMGYLREKLETDATKPKILLTEPGVGYRLAVTE